MKRQAILILCSGLAAVMVADAAQAKSKKRHHVTKPVAMERWNTPGLRQEPARMIEVKPGLWISSYGCIQDEGYGRYSFCDQQRGGI